MFFSVKIPIACKEALEKKYWLDLLKDGDYLEWNGYDVLYQEVDELNGKLF